MDLLFVIRDASASATTGTLLTAMRATNGGGDVGVLVTGEALAALDRGCFAWPRELQGAELRMAFADRGSELGAPVFARGDGRRLDDKALFATARAAGVTLYACPVWAHLLGLGDALPEGLEAVPDGDTAALLASAGRVVGAM